MKPDTFLKKQREKRRKERNRILIITGIAALVWIPIALIWVY